MKGPILQALQKVDSKENIHAVVDLIETDPQKFDALYKIFSHYKDTKIQYRAGWVMRFCVERNPDFLNKYLNNFIQILSLDYLSDGIKRNGFATLSVAVISKDQEGRVMHLCFKILENPSEKVAAQVFALRILHQFSLENPEIIPEIKLLILQNNGLKKPAMKAAVKNLFPHFLH